MSIIWRCDEMSVINCRMIIRRGLISQELSLISLSTVNVVPIQKQNFPSVLVYNTSRSYFLTNQAKQFLQYLWRTVVKT